MLRSYICPICNGLDDLSVTCQSCGGKAEDRGRLSDYYAPYAPYRPIDDLKLTNGFPDLEQHQCIHAVFCPSCRSTLPYAVDEVWG